MVCPGRAIQSTIPIWLKSSQKISETGAEVVRQQWRPQEHQMISALTEVEGGAWVISCPDQLRPEAMGISRRARVRDPEQQAEARSRAPALSHRSQSRRRSRFSASTCHPR